MPLDPQVFVDAFVYSASAGQASVVRKRLEARSVDVNAHDSEGLSAVRASAMQGDTYILDLLIGSGADIHDRDKHTLNQALHLAALWGKSGAVSYLVAHGADPQSANSDGDTPLHLAARNGHHNVLASLVSQGQRPPDPHMRNEAGKTPIQVARDGGQSRHNCVSVLRDAEIYFRRHCFKMVHGVSQEPTSRLSMLPAHIITLILDALAGPAQEVEVDYDIDGVPPPSGGYEEGKSGCVDDDDIDLFVFEGVSGECEKGGDRGPLCHARGKGDRERRTGRPLGTPRE